MTYVPANFEVAMSNGLGDAFKKIQYLTLTLASRSQNIAKHLLHHVTYASCYSEFNGLGDAFIRKYSIYPLALGQGHMKCCPALSTSCDLCTCNV